MRRVWLALGAIALAASYAAGSPVSTFASGACLGEQSPWDPPTNPATVIFVGTVVETEAYEQNALMHVEEVWFGGPLPEYVALIQQEQRNTYSSGSEEFRLGERYIAGGERNGDRIQMNCVLTGPYTSAMALRAPSRVTEPSPAARPAQWGIGDPLWTDAFLLLIPLAMVVVPALVLAGNGRVWRPAALRSSDYVFMAIGAGLIVLLLLIMLPLG